MVLKTSLEIIINNIHDLLKQQPKIIDMLNFFKSKKPIEVKINRGSKTVVIFPCRLQLTKNQTDSRSYEMIGYTHEGNYYKFLYLERSQGGNLYVNSIKIPINIATKLMNQGTLKTEEFSYVFEKL